MWRVGPDRGRQNHRGRGRVWGHKFQTTGAGAGFNFFKIPGPGRARVCDFSKYRGRGRAGFHLIFTEASAELDQGSYKKPGI